MTDYIVLQLFFWICSFLALRLFLYNYKYSFYMQFLCSDNALVKYFVRIGL